MMACVNLNDPQSILGEIERTQEEIGLAKRNVWPHTSMVPVESRGRYLDTMQEYLTYLTTRYDCGLHE